MTKKRSADSPVLTKRRCVLFEMHGRQAICGGVANWLESCVPTTHRILASTLAVHFEPYIPLFSLRFFNLARSKSLFQVLICCLHHTVADLYLLFIIISDSLSICFYLQYSNILLHIPMISYHFDIYKLFLISQYYPYYCITPLLPYYPEAWALHPI